MAIVSAEKFVQAARDNGYAVGGFNTNNLEWTQAILRAAEAKKAPVSKLLWVQLSTWVVTNCVKLLSKNWLNQWVSLYQLLFTLITVTTMMLLSVSKLVTLQSCLMVHTFQLTKTLNWRKKL